jgi:hypothetical protein
MLDGPLPSRWARTLVPFWCLMATLPVVAVGCVTPWMETSPPLPEQHIQVRKQLVIHSDFRLPQRHRLIDELARQREEVASTLGLPRSDELIHVYLFGDERKFHAHLERIYPGLDPRRAIFVKTDWQLVVLAHWGDRIAEDLRHEVAHAYLHGVLPAIPLWLDEGLAEFFEVPREDRGLNVPHITLLWERLQVAGWKPRLERLESIGELADLRQIDYAESWLWMHFLLETTPVRRQRLQNYLVRLHESGLVVPLSGDLRSLDEDYHHAARQHLEQLKDSLPSAPLAGNP